MYEFPEWTVVLALFLGATFGSFLNVVIYRLPRGLSLSDPAYSFCPHCKHRLYFWPDMVPLLSWLASRGRCRYCKAKIPVRYFLVELLNGGLWSVFWWQHLVMGWDPWRFGFYAAMASALVAVVFIDWELLIIPDELNAFILVLGVGFHAVKGSLPVALQGALFGWGLLWGITLFGRLAFGKDAMGHGDIKLMRGVGALLGPVLLPASVMLAVVAGLVIGVATIALARRAAPAEGEGPPEGEIPPPESVASIVKCGIWYLLCLDIVAIFFPRMNRLLGEEAQMEAIEEDDWQPGPTTIPFGPYLAVGAVACMAFAAPIEREMRAYFGLDAPKASVLPSTRSSRPMSWAGGSAVDLARAGRAARSVRMG